MLLQKIHIRLGRKNSVPPMKFGTFELETGEFATSLMVAG